MLTDADITQRLAGLPGWSRTQVGKAAGITRSFKRRNFLDGLGLVTRVAVLAEMANHHPDVVLTWPAVTFTLTTHDAGGLTDKDFALAQSIDSVATT